MSGGPSLYLFDSGTLVLRGFEVPVPFFLIRHPQGDVMVDGGNPLAVARNPYAHWGALAEELKVRMTESQHCAAQLRRLGLAPDSVEYIVQTHLHVDHTGALGHFPNATVVVHARELEAARAAQSPVQTGYAREDYDLPELRFTRTEGDLDLFGDNTIRLFETPGHSAGHVSVLLELEHTGAVLLTGDAADNRAQWEGRVQPRGLFSPDAATRSLERLRQLARETGALVVPGHDPNDWARLKRAPDCYV